MLSIKFILKSSKSFSDGVVNEKEMCWLSFICFGSSKLTFTNNDFPLIYSQLFILFKLIVPSILYIVSFIKAIFALSNALQVTNICFAMFVTDDGNNIPIGVSL